MMTYWEKQYLDNQLQSWTLRIERVVYEYKLGRLENYEAIDDISSYYTRGKEALSYLISDLELTTAQASEARGLWNNRLLSCYRACLYMIERQVIVTWYDPADKLPEEGLIVIATVSGSTAGLRLSRTLLTMCYCESEGWYSPDLRLDDITVHEWCDLEPYKGGIK